MVRNKIISAALLLMSLTSTAVAASEPGNPTSEKARKAVILLGALGVNSEDAKAFITNIDSRMEGETLNFAKERVGDGTLKLHYRMGKGLGVKNLELQYTPDNSSWKAVGKKKSVMLHYKYSF